ncbi:MAG: ABC transporter permease [Clostridia bacterium]|nr:ABC transporter permease [Clostridia bacterium]
MKNILTIVKKELRRFFSDKRLVLTALLPGILIYAIYSLMGGALEGAFGSDENAVYVVYAENLPDSVKTICEATEKFDLREGFDKDKITDGDGHLAVRFPADFETTILGYDSTSGTPAPKVEIYYDSTDTDSYNAYSTLFAILSELESALSNKFDVNPGDTVYDLASEEAMTAQIFAMMLPMLLMMLLFSGCMAVAPESIAGEKERGTIATLLVTPIARRELAIGKIISLSLIALFGGASSFIGTMLSLPKLMGGTAELDASVYTMTDYAMLLIVILSTVLVMISIIAVLSALANSVKEAGTIVTPFMMVNMLLGISAMFGSGSASELYWYCIPLYNSVQCMTGVFSFTWSPLQIVVTVAVNLLFAGGMVALLTKLFSSEKVMFSK